MNSEEKIRVNIGAGREKFPGWISFDLPPEENVSFEDVDVTPDIIGTVTDLPFGDDSVDVLRTKDLLLDFEADNSGRISALGEEFRRVLKPGGRLITIEVPEFARKFSRQLEIASIRKGARIPYMRGERFLVTVYVKK